jgi:hypothetical protein
LISAQPSLVEAWTIYRSTCFRAWLQLSGTSFSRKELAKIESSPIRTLQSAMVNRNMPLEVVFVQLIEASVSAFAM